MSRDRISTGKSRSLLFRCAQVVSRCGYSRTDHRSQTSQLTKAPTPGARVVIISELGFDAAANQTLTRTIEAYLAVGYDVVFITSAPPNEIRLSHGRFKAVSLHDTYRPRPVRLFLGAWRATKPPRQTPAGPLPLATSSIQPLTNVGTQLAKLLWFSIVAAPPVYRAARAKHTVLLYGYEVFGAPIARFVGMLTKTPSVGRFQGSILHWATARRAPLYFIGTALAPRRVVMANDGTYGDLVLRDRGFGPGSYLFIHNGVDDLSALRSGDLPQGFRPGTDLVWANRQEDWKRPDIAIEAWFIFLRDFRELSELAGRPHLWMFGGGNLTDASRSYARRLGVDKHIHVAGATRYPVVQRALVESRAVLSTNDYSNLTNSVLTAMYHRVPVVIRDWGQAEALAPGVPWTSSATDAGAAADIARAIAHCLEAPSIAPRFHAGHLWRDRMAKELEFTLATPRARV